jgi:uncharacterized membrane protein YphA (DoxX/SURF4 family)
MRNKIIYWVATLWASLGMVSTAIVQIFHIKANSDFIYRLGYPEYFLTLLGIWKVLGVVALLLPRTPLLKEWAYAGFFFAMTGAVYSHIAAGDPWTESLRALFLLLLIVVSWYFRPADKKMAYAPKG